MGGTRRHDQCLIRMLVSHKSEIRLFRTVIFFIGNLGKNVNLREDGPTQSRVGFGPLDKVQ